MRIDLILEGSVNNAATDKFRFQLIATFMILTGLLSNLHVISAQSANVGEIIIGVDGDVSSNLGPNNYQLIRIVAPQYPVRALQRQITGWNLISFSVDDEGNVDTDTIVVIDSEPSGIFG